MDVPDKQDFERKYEEQKRESRTEEDLSNEKYAANPFNWSKKRKWIVVATVSCMMLLK